MKYYNLDTLSQRSHDSYANAKFASAAGSRYHFDTLLQQSHDSYANAKFASAAGSRFAFGGIVAVLRDFNLDTLLQQSHKSYANAKFASAAGSRDRIAFLGIVAFIATLWRYNYMYFYKPLFHFTTFKGYNL